MAPSGPDEVVAVVRDVTELRQAVRDLTDSRARIVAAGDAERRRVERNLHDGAQQRLVTVALHLHLVKRRLETDPGEVKELIESAQTELTLALEEIRELVRGLHPRLLSDRGLEPALAGLAERAVLPVEIAETPSERLPPAVEAAAYYLVAEALANAAKHSQASHVTVRVSADGGCTTVEIADDGVGGADPGDGLRPARPRRPCRGARRRAGRRQRARLRDNAPRRAAARAPEPVGPPAAKKGGNAPAARNTPHANSTEVGMDRTPVQNIARLVGIVFLLVGVAGFIPGVTTDLYDGLEFAGNDGTSELLGIFKVSVLHNIVHGLFGIAGLALAATASGARTFLIGGGADLPRPLPARDRRRRRLDPRQRRGQLAASRARRGDDRARRAQHARQPRRLDRLARPHPPLKGGFTAALHAFLTYNGIQITQAGGESPGPGCRRSMQTPHPDREFPPCAFALPFCSPSLPPSPCQAPPRPPRSSIATPTMSR